MPVKRRSAKVRDHRITPEAVLAYESGDSSSLHRALGLKPWDLSPLETENPYPHGAAAARSWPTVCALRAELTSVSRRGAARQSIPALEAATNLSKGPTP